MVQGVNPVSTYSSAYVQRTSNQQTYHTDQATDAVTKDNAQQGKTDKVAISEEGKTYKVDKEAIQKLKGDLNSKVSAFETMVSKLVTKQGQKSNLNLFGMDLFVSEADSIKAQEAIGEDGDWGVNAVSTRIMDMANALSGGDPSKISTLKSAVEKGFSSAGLQFGREMPSITNDTHTEIMNRFDEWEKTGQYVRPGEGAAAEEKASKAM